MGERAPLGIKGDNDKEWAASLNLGHLVVECVEQGLAPKSFAYV